LCFLYVMEAMMIMSLAPPIPSPLFTGFYECEGAV
jgi:hypothetical protein